MSLLSEKVKLKVPQPEKFSGTAKENYEDFEKKLRTYLCLSDAKFPTILKWVVTEEHEITDALIGAIVEDAEKTNDIINRLQPFLYYTLLSVVDGSAHTIIDQVENENGLEAYRRLHQIYAKSKMQNAIMRMATIVNTKFHDNANFEATFTDWEYEIHHFNLAVDTKLQDEVKVGILIAGTTGKLHDHLCLTLGKQLNYESVRGVILNYIKSKNLTTKTNNQQQEKPQWMYVGAIGITKGGKGR